MKIQVEITMTELSTKEEPIKVRFVPKQEATINDVLQAEHALNKLAESFTIFSVNLVRAKE